MKDFKTLLAGARLPERVVQVCLRGDLAAEVEQLDAELERIQKLPSTSLAGNGSGPLVEKIEALQEQMREHTYPVRLRALPRTKRHGDDRPSWVELKEAHPPRFDEDGGMVVFDRMAGGLNRDTFIEPLVRASIYDPQMDDADWGAFSGSITDRQFEELAGAAWDLSQGKVDVPFSRAASQARKNSASE